MTKKRTTGQRGDGTRRAEGPRRTLALGITALCGAVWGAEHSGAPSAAARNELLETAPIAGNCMIGGGFGIPRPGNRLHRGIDIMAPHGTPLAAVATGRIKRLTPKETNARGGNQVTLVSLDGDLYYYTHLDRFADGLVSGAAVTAGQVIGFVGATGNAATPHLHFQVHPGGGEPVDPLLALLGVNTCGGRGANNATTVPSPATSRPPAPSTATTTKPTSTKPATTNPPPTKPKPTTTSAPATTHPGRSTTTSPPTTRPRPAGSSTTRTPATHPPETPATEGARDLKAVVYRQRRIPANDVVGIQVVGFPGLSARSRVVDVSIMVRGASGGRAAIWPCGQRSGLDRGTPLPVTLNGSTTRLVLPIGHKNRICFVSDTRTDVTVIVHSASS